MLLLSVSGWVNRHQVDSIAGLVEENRVLKEEVVDRPPEQGLQTAPPSAALQPEKSNRT